MESSAAIQKACSDLRHAIQANDETRVVEACSVLMFADAELDDYNVLDRDCVFECVVDALSSTNIVGMRAVVHLLFVIQYLLLEIEFTENQKRCMLEVLASCCTRFKHEEAWLLAMELIVKTSSDQDGLQVLFRWSRTLSNEGICLIPNALYLFVTLCLDEMQRRLALSLLKEMDGGTNPKELRAEAAHYYAKAE